jgi:hypothetical protein
MNVNSPNKRELAEILRRIADLIEASSNDSVTVILNVQFKKKDC